MLLAEGEEEILNLLREVKAGANLLLRYHFEVTYGVEFRAQLGIGSVEDKLFD